jgi:ribosomal protein S18 acetylase RimI-like enzyme
MPESSPNVVLRPLRPDDLPRIKELVELGWRGQGAAYLIEKRYGQIGEQPWLEWKWSEVERACRERPQDVIVSTVEDNVVGFASCHLDPVRRVGTIGNNTVDPAYRGLGIGGRMHDRVLEMIRTAGMLFAEVTVALNEGHAAARAMYEKAGFEEVVDSRYMFMKVKQE